ncbi:SsuE family FMN reductase [Paraburkholderia sp. BL27I4N3]|uniref:NADPH-dependent FMN reductase n=1 Tax=Paraburkholderia sp. BL27I4N3 TaxID=1938805 RepID=UPI000E26F910|nr:NADPH-dependent FMN reductase [Paraburkholderia sp. BL27I4N3]REE07499.1 SsuE family FMN reductase [Paraburkholderia sp. BL27I4N3]
MKTRSVVAVSASPSSSSKTAFLVDHVLDHIASPSLCVRHDRLRDISPQTLLTGDLSDVVLADIVQAIDQADGIIIATPIFKASFTGLLKVFLDVLPQFGLAGKAVLCLGTGGSPAHVLSLDYGLRPVLQSMAARHVVQSHFIVEKDLIRDERGFSIAESAAGPLWEAVHHFEQVLRVDEESRWLGHPRPPGGPLYSVEKYKTESRHETPID